MPPWTLLAAVLLATLAALAVASARHRRQAERVRELASAWRMNFGRRDTVQLTARVAPYFPIPGAAVLVVDHLVYGVEAGVHRYLFTARYTLGVTGAKRRHARVAMLVEPRDPTGRPVARLELADEELSVLDQYRQLRERAVEGSVEGEAEIAARAHET